MDYTLSISNIRKLSFFLSFFFFSFYFGPPISLFSNLVHRLYIEYQLAIQESFLSFFLFSFYFGPPISLFSNLVHGLYIEYQLAIQKSFLSFFLFSFFLSISDPRFPFYLIWFIDYTLSIS